MPADGRTRGIFRNHAFYQVSSGEPGESRCTLTNGREKRRKALCGRGPASGEVIFETKFQHATVGRVAVKIKCLKRQLTEDTYQLGLFGFAEEIRLVEKTFWQIVDGEKCA